MVSQLPSHDGDPVHPVLVGHDEPARDRGEHGGREDEEPRRDAGDEQQGRDDPDEDQRRSEVVAHENQADGDDDDRDQERDDDVLEAAEQLPLARQDGGADEDEPELHQLGRLELDAGQQADPVAVAVDRDAERREHQHLQRERAHQGGQGESAVPPHRDVRRDDRADDADRGELGLVEEHAERRAVVAVGRDHRRGQDHDEADDDEDHRRSEQHVVGGDRRLQAREERQCPVQQARVLAPAVAARAVRPGLDRPRRRTGRRARHRRGPSAQRRTAASKASPRAP